MTLTPGKIKGLENLSDDRGVIAAAAMITGVIRKGLVERYDRGQARVNFRRGVSSER